MDCNRDKMQKLSLNENIVSTVKTRFVLNRPAAEHLGFSQEMVVKKYKWR